MVAGRWVRAFSLRRQGFAALDEIWRHIAHGRRRGLMPFKVVDELVMAVALLPLLPFDWRLPISGVMTASDASEHC